MSIRQKEKSPLLILYVLQRLQQLHLQRLQLQRLRPPPPNYTAKCANRENFSLLVKISVIRVLRARMLKTLEQLTTAWLAPKEGHQGKDSPNAHTCQEHITSRFCVCLVYDPIGLCISPLCRLQSPSVQSICDVVFGWQLDNDGSLRPADNANRGDGDLPEGSARWAVFDSNNRQNSVEVEHVKDDEYQIKSSSYYLGAADGDDGDGDYCSSTNPSWAYFGTRVKSVKLAPHSTFIDTYQIKSSASSQPLGTCTGGDDDKESNTKWAQFGIQSWLEFVHAG